MNKLISKSLVGIAIAAMSFALPLAVAAQSPTTGGDRVQNGLESIKDAYPSGAQGTGSDTVGTIAKKIIDWALYLAAIVAVIFIIVGGYYYITAAGNDARAASGRKTLVNALIGLALVVLSFIIVQIIYRFLVQ